MYFYYRGRSLNRIETDKKDKKRTKWICLSVKYIKVNEIENKNVLDAPSKSDARWDGKQDFFYMALSKFFQGYRYH